LNNELKIVEEREALISTSIEDLSSSLPDIQKEIYRKLLKTLSELDIDKDGYIKTTSANLKAISKYVVKDIKTAINNSDYPEKINEFIDVFDEVSYLTDEYINGING